MFSRSVNGGNSVELAKKEDIDGFLVGGASLKVTWFVHNFFDWMSIAWVDQRNSRDYVYL